MSSKKGTSSHALYILCTNHITGACHFLFILRCYNIFFSKNITEETTASELAHYIGLEESPVIWADKIVKVVEDYMPKRRSYAAEVKINGFDSKSEALRMQSFYLAQINSVDGYERNS